MMTISRRKYLFAAAASLSWIALAHFFRHPGDTDPQSVQSASSAMALWFVACGAWAHMRRGGGLGELFFVYCALSGVHWGGPIGIGPQWALDLQLGAFVVVGTVLTQAVFVDLARRVAAGKIPPFRWLPYAPAVIGAAFLLALAIQPHNKTILNMFSVLYAAGIILSLIGGVIFLALPFMSNRNRFKNGVVAALLAAGWLPHGLVSGGLLQANEYEGLFNLSLALIPAALAWNIASLKDPADQKLV